MKKSISNKLTFLLSVLILLTANGCGTMGTGDGDKTWKSGAIGTVGGALAGAAIGAATGKDWKKGAAIGAAAGLVVGTTTGVILDRQEEKLRQKGIQTQRDENGRLLVTLAGDSLRFQTGSSTLSETGKANLAKVAEILKEYPENRIAIQGHTDTVGKKESNLILSNSRALTVQNTLQGYGVSSRCIIEAKGYGQDVPVADNSTDEGRSANRRVDLVISADEEEAKKNQTEREKYKKKG